MGAKITGVVLGAILWPIVVACLIGIIIYKCRQRIAESIAQSA